MSPLEEEFRHRSGAARRMKVLRSTVPIFSPCVWIVQEVDCHTVSLITTLGASRAEASP